MAELALIAAAVMAVGQISQGQQQAQQFKYNAAINENNARLYRAQAAEAERKQRQHLQALLGSQRAAIGKSGVTMAGTPLLVAEDMNGQGELDALTIRYNGEMKANAELYQAAVNKYQAKTAKTNSYWAAAGTLIGGASTYSQMSTAAAGNPMLTTTGSTGATGLSVPNPMDVWDTYTGFDPTRA